MEKISKFNKYKINIFHSANVPSKCTNVGEKPIFINFWGKKRSNWEKFKKKLLRASTRDHDPL